MHYDENSDILGKGNFGVVFRATDVQFNAEIAVKYIDKETFTGDHTAFFEEAAVLFASRHVNVIEVLYACEDDDRIYIAMPVYSQGSLGRLLTCTSLTLREVIRFSLGILNGLHHIHTLGLVHGDIKPDNILISDSGHAVVSDFGLAQYLIPETGTAEFPVMYQPHWAPEYLQSTSLTSKADVYQAALTIYRMIYGVDSVTEAWVSAGEDALTKLRDGNLLPFQPSPIMSRRLLSTLKNALHPDPDQRTGSCLDLANGLAAQEELLDWRPSPIEAGMQYKNLIDARQGIVTLLTEPSGEWRIESTKKRGTGRQKVTEYCKRGLTQFGAIQMARTAMRALEG